MTARMGLLIVWPCKPMGTDVGDAVGVEIAREIPTRDGLAAAADFGRGDLAVEEPATEHALASGPGAPGADGEGSTRRRGLDRE